MAITPNSTVILLKGVPIDKGYNHTLYFDSETQQTNWFSHSTRYHPIRLTNYSYQREGDGMIYVSTPMSSCYDCNYLMFKNTSYENKWFYAFITNVEYENDNTSIIHYVIDPLQTWYFNFEFGDCFIERETVASDNINENLVPENFGNLDYIYGSEEFVDLSTYNILIETTIDLELLFIDGQGKPLNVAFQGFNEINNATSGLYYYIWDSRYPNSNLTKSPWYGTADEQDLTSLLRGLEYFGLTENIISISLVPRTLYQYNPATDEHPPTDYYFACMPVKKSIKIEKIFSQPTTYPHLSSTVKNKKLLTYPFTMLEIQTPDGNVSELRYDKGVDDKITLRVESEISPSPVVEIRPVNYENTQNNASYTLALNGLPLVPYSYSLYSQWLARNSASLATQYYNVERQAVSSLLTTPLASSVRSGATGFFPSLLTTTTDALVTTTNTEESIKSKVLDAQAQPRNVINRPSKSYLPFQQSRYGFFIRNKQLSEYQYNIIDDYFTMFGYACDKVKKPSLKNRTRYTYLKTKSCVIHAKNNKSLPSSAEDFIASVFDNGITYWVASDTNTVGDYETVNAEL